MKKKGSKKRILAVTAALLLLLCTACGGTAGNTADDAPVNTANDAAGTANTVLPGPAVPPEPSAYVLPPDGASRFAARENGITINNDYEIDRVRCLSISGLKDEAVQKKINDRIRAEADRLLDPSFVPQGRGIKLYEKLARPTVTIFGANYANCDNILSIVITYSRLYRIEKEVKQIMHIQPLNFDLATGDLLSLADLFPEGMDVKQYLNARLLKMVQDSDPAQEYAPHDERFYYIPRTVPALISEFKGVRDDQPFYLEDKGVLALVLDPGNQEFYIPQGSEAVRVDMADVYAGGARFGGNKGLYEDNTDRYRLVSLPVPGGSILSSKQVSDYVDADPRWFSGNVSIQYYPGLSEKQNDFLSMGFLDIQGVLEKEAAELSEYRKSYPGSQKYVDISSSASRTGSFLNLVASFNSYTNYSVWSKSTEHHWMRCMAYGSDEVLDISSIFKEGVDWKNVLKQAIINHRGETVGDPVSGLDPQRFSDYVDDMLGRISGFNIGSVSLLLSYDGSSAPEFFDDYERNSWYYNNLISNIAFDAIGCEYLNIFE